MKKLKGITITAAITVGVVLLYPAGVHAGIFDDVDFKDLPQAVQKTINDQAAGGKIREIERETEDGKRMEFKVSDTGKLLTQPMTTAERAAQKVRDKTSGLIDNDLTLKKLSPEAQATVKKETAGGKITEIEQEKEDGLTFYEIEFEQDGEDREIRVDQAGKVVKRDN
jgi:uncharacterized membrane protein YkoI